MTDNPTPEQHPVADPAPMEPVDPATTATARPGLRERLRGRARTTSRPVRWAAGALLAVLLVLGIGAVGFAVGHEAGGSDGRSGGSGEGHRGDARDGGRGDTERGSGDHTDDGQRGRGDNEGDDEGDDDGADPESSDDDSSTPTPTPSPSAVVPTATTTPSTGQ